MTKQIPYNTGKVRIGCRYEPPQRSYITPEGEYWQKVFLGRKPGMTDMFVGPVPITWYVIGLCVLFLLVMWVVR